MKNGVSQRILPIASALSCLLTLSTAMAGETVTVNLAKDAGEPRYRASGFLHGFSDDGQVPPESAVVSLKIQLHRTRPGSTWSQAARMKASGIRQQVVISDGWGYGREHPGDDGNWQKWEAFVAGIVEEAARRGLKPQWDLWNEPDHEFFWKRSPEQFNETWRRAYLQVRKHDPGAIIVGPSWSNVHPGEKRFSEFVLFCQKNQVVPDYLCWHFPRSIVKEAEACRRFLDEQKIPVKGLMVNEYALKHEQYAGRTAWLIAQVERARLDFACHAIWGDEGQGNLDGILDDPKKGLPRGQWWAYERYAAITGRLVETTPMSKIDLVAGRDDPKKVVRVLLGNAGGVPGEVTVRFVELDAVPYLKGNRVHVVVEKIPEDEGKAVPRLPVVADRLVAVAKGVLEVKIPWESDRDAYALRLQEATSIGPASASNPPAKPDLALRGCFTTPFGHQKPREIWGLTGVVKQPLSPSPSSTQPIPSVQALVQGLPCSVDYFEVAGCPAFLIRPKNKSGPSPTPWVWYAPVIGHPNPSHAWMLKQWLAKGIGMAGVDVGESHGSPRGRQVYSELWKTLCTEYRMSERPCLLPQSRGGLMLYNWAAENPTRLSCIAGIYTVCDLGSYPGLENACGAYGMSEAELRSHLAEHNPIARLALLAKAGVPILHIHGDADRVVPLEKNSGELVRRYRELGGNAQLIVIPGKGHEVCPEFFQCQELVDFVIAQARVGSSRSPTK